MATILVLSFTDLKRDPRVRRQIEALRTHHAVIAAGTGDPEIPDVRFLGCKRNARTFTAKCLEGVELLLHRYESHYWKRGHVQELRHEIKGLAFDAAIANDLEALPLALKMAQGSSVILDAHEYFPLEFEDRWLWRWFFASYTHDMCRRYMPKAARVTTVCQGIANRYTKEFGVRTEVITNTPHFHDLPIRPTDGSVIRLIHHGAAMVSRRIELMIELMGFLDERFSLDLILMPGKLDYIERMRCLARGKPKIRFLEPVPMDQLVILSAQYDIGLFLLPPTNFNYEMALPNKFFEFIQARLAVAIGPSPEMAQIVREFGCGVVADDFEPASLARVLNQLTAVDIDRMKAGSERAAKVHTAERNAEKLREVVAGVLGEL
ncbi:MAG TPA: hypothetical protein VN666_18795 [Nitrospira sp.]|nr:hypothetical protein [Nitrospira sp.]